MCPSCWLIVYLYSWAGEMVKHHGRVLDFFFHFSLKFAVDMADGISKYFVAPSIRSRLSELMLPTWSHFQLSPLHNFALLLSKYATILRTFGCEACVWYTFIRRDVIMGILGFVYFYPRVALMACFPPFHYSYYYHQQHHHHQEQKHHHHLHHYLWIFTSYFYLSFELIPMKWFIICWMY